MGNDTESKLVCSCGWRGTADQLLHGSSPFAPHEYIYGCPRCQAIEQCHTCCDEPDCWEQDTCGTPTPGGYRRTCDKHAPKQEARRCGHHDPPQRTFGAYNTTAHPCGHIEEVAESAAQVRVIELEAALARIGRIADNLALLCYASGCGIGTTTMQEYEAMKQARTHGGEVGK